MKGFFFPATVPIDSRCVSSFLRFEMPLIKTKSFSICRTCPANMEGPSKIQFQQKSVIWQSRIKRDTSKLKGFTKASSSVEGRFLFYYENARPPLSISMSKIDTNLGAFVIIGMVQLWAELARQSRDHHSHFQCQKWTEISEFFFDHRNDAYISWIGMWH